MHCSKEKGSRLKGEKGAWRILIEVNLKNDHREHNAAWDRLGENRG